VLLFTALFSFIILIVAQLANNGWEYNQEYINNNSTAPYFFDSEYYMPKKDINIVSSISVILVGFGCQSNLFPIYQELKLQTNMECTKSFGYGILMVSFIYIVLSIISVYMFGSGTGSDQTILASLSTQCNPWCPWQSYVLRFMFLVVLACHIPFIFFFGKEGLLIIVDELDRKTISQAMQLKIENADLFN